MSKDYYDVSNRAISRRGRVLRAPQLSEDMAQQRLNFIEQRIQEQNELIGKIANTLQQITKTIPESNYDHIRNLKRQKNEIKMLLELKNLRKRIHQIELGPTQVTQSQHMMPQVPNWNPYPYYPQGAYYMNPWYQQQAAYQQQGYNQYQQFPQNPQQQTYDAYQSPHQMKAKLLEQMVQQGKVVIVDSKKQRSGKQSTYQTPLRNSMISNQQPPPPPPPEPVVIPELPIEPTPKPETPPPPPPPPPPPGPTAEEIDAENRKLFQDYTAKQAHNLKVYTAELEKWKQGFTQKFLLDAKILLTKDWVFVGMTKPKEVTDKSKLAIQLCNLVVSSLNTIIPLLSQGHLNFIKSFSTGTGYPLQGFHSLFVAKRMSQKADYTLQINDELESEMIMLDYLYNKFVLNVILEINVWYPNYTKIPKFKESVKIFVSILHQLFFDFYQEMNPRQDSQIQPTTSIKFCDFSLTNYLDVVKTIDSSHPQFKLTDTQTILGLYTAKDIGGIYQNPSPQLDDYQKMVITLQEFTSQLMTRLNAQ